MLTPRPIQHWLLISLPAPLPQEFVSAGLFLHGISCSWTAAARALTHSPAAAAFPLRVWHAEQGKSPPAPWRQAWCREGSRCRTWWESFLNPCVVGVADDVALLKLLLAWGLASQQPRPRRLPWGPRSQDKAGGSRVSAASSPVPTRLEKRQRRWEGVGSSEGPVLPVPDARGCVSCQRHHLLPGSSLGAVLPTPPQRVFSFPLLRKPPPAWARQLGEAEAAAGPWARGAAVPLPCSNPLFPAVSQRLPGKGSWLACVGSCSSKGHRAAGSASCLPAPLAASPAPRGSAVGVGHGYFRRCHPGCNLGCLLFFSPPPPPPPLARCLSLPPHPQVIKNSACGVKFLTLQLIKSL